MYCPHCKEEIETLDYEANYSETVYGTSSGTYDISNDCHDISDQESNNSDNWEEDEYEYTCPECNHLVDIDDLLEELEDDDEDDDSEKIDKKELDKQVRLMKFFKRS